MERQLQPVAVEPRIGREPVGRIEAGILSAGLLAGEESQGLVGGDAVEPGVELRVAAKVFERAPYLQEGILESVVGIVVVEDHPTDMPVQAFLVRLHKKAERLFASAFPI